MDRTTTARRFTTRIDRAAAFDTAARSRTRIGQGIALVNDDFGSLTFRDTTFGRETIVFTST